MAAEGLTAQLPTEAAQQEEPVSASSSQAEAAQGSEAATAYASLSNPPVAEIPLNAQSLEQNPAPVLSRYATFLGKGDITKYIEDKKAAVAQRIEPSDRKAIESKLAGNDSKGIQAYWDRKGAIQSYIALRRLQTVPSINDPDIKDVYVLQALMDGDIGAQTVREQAMRRKGKADENNPGLKRKNELKGYVDELRPLIEGDPRHEQVKTQRTQEAYKAFFTDPVIKNAIKAEANKIVPHQSDEKRLQIVLEMGKARISGKVLSGEALVYNALFEVAQGNYANPHDIQIALRAVQANLEEQRQQTLPATQSETLAGLEARVKTLQRRLDLEQKTEQAESLTTIASAASAAQTSEHPVTPQATRADTSAPTLRFPERELPRSLSIAIERAQRERWSRAKLTAALNEMAEQGVIAHTTIDEAEVFQAREESDGRTTNVLYVDTVNPARPDQHSHYSFSLTNNLGEHTPYTVSLAMGNSTESRDPAFRNRPIAAQAHSYYDIQTRLHAVLGMSSQNREPWMSAVNTSTPIANPLILARHIVSELVPQGLFSQEADQPSGPRYYDHFSVQQIPFLQREVVQQETAPTTSTPDVADAPQAVAQQEEPASAAPVQMDTLSSDESLISDAPGTGDVGQPSGETQPQPEEPTTAPAFEQATDTMQAELAAARQAQKEAEAREERERWNAEAEIIRLAEQLAYESPGIIRGILTKTYDQERSVPCTVKDRHITDNEREVTVQYGENGADDTIIVTRRIETIKGHDQTVGLEITKGKYMKYSKIVNPEDRKMLGHVLSSPTEDIQQLQQLQQLLEAADMSRRTGENELISLLQALQPEAYSVYDFWTSEQITEQARKRARTEIRKIKGNKQSTRGWTMRTDMYDGKDAVLIGVRDDELYISRDDEGIRVIHQEDFRKSGVALSDYRDELRAHSMNLPRYDGTGSIRLSDVLLLQNELQIADECDYPEKRKDRERAEREAQKAQSLNTPWLQRLGRLVGIS